MKQVLIVDDSKQIRERLAALLTESDQIQIVGMAENGDQVLDVIQHLVPDTVILDIQLPGVSGIKILKKIKSRYPKMTVIMLTNYDFTSYRKKCRQLGADHFLSKTREIHKIVSTVTADANNDLLK
jgi:DNA-binding NarL/FixJ family response regulator